MPPIKNAFTLMELSMVVMVLALMAAAGMRYATSIKDSNNLVTANATLDVIDAALLNFRIQYGRLPCPADINTYGENNSSFGLEAGSTTGGTGTGGCVSGATDGALTPSAAYINSGTDPDNADLLYDNATASKVEAGGIPTKTLKIPDKYAYDAWGRRILYVVDKRITATNAFTTYTIASGTGNGTIGAIVIKRKYNDTLANAVTYKAIYALVSFGKNGHGGYARALNTTPIIETSGSINTDEQKNCHCDGNAAATAFDRIFVQKAKTANSTSLYDTFDDVVRYKNRNEVVTSSESQ